MNTLFDMTAKAREVAWSWLSRREELVEVVCDEKTGDVLEAVKSVVESLD